MTERYRAYDSSFESSELELTGTDFELASQPEDKNSFIEKSDSLSTKHKIRQLDRFAESLTKFDLSL